jgi:signal transduction histidine kinase/DNA-binding NarL/FixJ family response regulator
MDMDIKAADNPPHPHPRRLGWIGTTALAMGGSNQSLFLIAALFVGQGAIPGQGSAAVPLLIVGLLLSYAAAPGWTELALMSPNRVGGIAASCAEAFKPYNPMLSTITGVCYWWGWVPTCGLTAIFSASAIKQWYLPNVSVTELACALVVLFTLVNLCGIKWTTRVATPVATASALLAFVSSLGPILAGQVDWHQATDFHLTVPFPGWFGDLTSLMAGLYLVGFAAPAFEAATCHVGETIDQNRNVPRAMLASALMAAVYFAVLPVVWLGALGPTSLGDDLALALGPTFTPIFGSGAKAMAIWFMMFNMFHGTLQPLAGASRTLAQLAEDGLAPRFLALRIPTDAPWAATLVTAGVSIGLLLIGDPIWLIAAANFNYLIAISLASVAVWLLRRDAPDAPRPYRAPRGTIGLGIAAAAGWGASTLFGFEQFGLPTVVFGLAMAYSGAALFAWRKIEDRRLQGQPLLSPTLHVKLTGAMLAVLALDGAGYILAIGQIPDQHGAFVTALEDIFVAVAILTITVGIVLPGMIAHSAERVSTSARRLALGTLKDFSNAMSALGRGDIDEAHAHFSLEPLQIHSRDELGRMTESFNLLQAEIGIAAVGLDGAREGLRRARGDLTNANLDLQRARDGLEERVRERTSELQMANRAKSTFLANMSHELRTPLNAILGYGQLLKRDTSLSERQTSAANTIQQSGEHLLMLITDILDLAKIESGKLELCPSVVDLPTTLSGVVDIVRIKSEEKGLTCILDVAPDLPRFVQGDDKRLRQVLLNLLSNAVKFTDCGQVGLYITLLSRHEGHACLRFEVRDTGVGIAQDKQQAIFEPFEQVGEVQSRSGGTGLGLSISRQLLRLMGGEISVESQPGDGSRFWFDLSLPVVDTAPVTALLVQQVNGYHGPCQTVLIVDDIAANRAMLADTLGNLGFAIREASNGLEGLELARTMQPDLILMDIRMPVMDGLEATRRILQIEALRLVPIIIVSASITSEDQAHALAAGACAFLSKPIENGHLLQKIGAHLRLDWIVEDAIPEPLSSSAQGTEQLAIPVGPEMERLHELALAGNMRGIKQWAGELAARDAQYQPFAEKLQKLAQGFRSEAIVRLVDTYMNPTPVAE